MLYHYNLSLNNKSNRFGQLLGILGVQAGNNFKSGGQTGH